MPKHRIKSTRIPSGFEAPPWSQIRATHIDRAGRRYKITMHTRDKRVTGDARHAHTLHAFIKLPSKRMLAQTCDGCSGPHRDDVPGCTANATRDAHGNRPATWLARADSRVLPAERGSLVLFDMVTHTPLGGGPWYITRSVVPGSRRSGIVEARRAVK